MSNGIVHVAIVKDEKGVTNAIWPRCLPEWVKHNPNGQVLAEYAAVMRYESERTAKGNVGVSYTSQEEADEFASKMDENGCTNCIRCNGSTYCRDCINCTNCTNCNGCNRCTDCTNCIRCNGSTYCRNCTDCTNCTNCNGCNRCTNCTNCNGCMVWRGHKVDNLLSVNGLTWPVSISSSHMQIGCQYHSHNEWQTFNDAEIRSMAEGANEFWGKYKNYLMQLCNLKATEQ